MDEITDAEEDLPGEEVREEGRRRRKESVFGEESADVGTEGAGEEVIVILIGVIGGHGGRGRGRREREEVEEISSDTSLHSFEGTGVNDHS